jgi:hypothetical protein
MQEIVAASQRGSITASNIFARNLGSTLGATLLGSVLNHSLKGSGSLAPITSEQLRQLLDPHAANAGDTAVRFALAQGLNLTFWVMLMLTVSTVAIALLVQGTPDLGTARRPVAEPLAGPAPD